MKHKKKFMPYEDQLICEMARKGSPVADIAKALDRPDRAIRDRMDRLVSSGQLSREARLLTKRRRVAQPHNVGAGANGMPIRIAGAVHSSAYDRARANMEQMVAAGMHPSAARNEVRQSMGIAL